MQLLNPIFRATSQIRHRLDRMQEQVLNMPLSRIMLFAAGKRETAYCVHLILAALFFSPFLLFGNMLAANTDLLLHNYPQLLLAKHNFLHGSFGLWNSYTFFGAPESVAAGTPIFFPENWALFLVPEQYLFPIITFLAFLKLWLIGIVSYRFFCAELLNRRWALFASITYQLSGWVIWALVSYVALSIVFYYTILLALLWTLKRRSSLQNYLLLSFVTTLMMLAGNIAHSCYALLGAGILLLYRVVSRWDTHEVFQPFAVFAASSATALLIFCARLLPVVETLASGSRADGCPTLCTGNFGNASFLITRFFDTEIFGVNYADSMKIFGAISPLFKTYHVHWAMPAFFGIAAALLVLWGLVSVKSFKAGFWSCYTVILLGILTFTQPFDVLALTLLAPAYHVIGFQLMLPIGFSALAAIGGMRLEKSLRCGRESRLTMQLFAFVVIIIALFILLIVIRSIGSLSADGSVMAKLLVWSLVVLSLLTPLARRSYPSVFRSLTLLSLWTIIIASLGIEFFYLDATNPTFLSHLKNLGSELLLFASIALALVLLQYGRNTMTWRFALWGGGIAVIVCLVVNLYYWTGALQHNLSYDQTLILSGLGALRFALGVSVFFLVFGAIRAGRLPARSLYIVFLFLLLAEQIPAGKIHSHINTNPFYASSNPYPPMAPPVGVDGHPIKLDLANYRVNFPNTMLQPPFYKELFGVTNEVCSSINVAYGIRSYGGFNNTIPNKTVWFLQNWAPDAPGSFCIYAKQSDERFLDLSNVGYEYNRDTKTVAVRPNSLSRMMLFTQFEVVPDDSASASGFGPVLDRLKAPDFQPLGEIVLQESPGFQSRSSSMNGKKLEFNEIDSDHIEVHVNSDGPALLFFDDSFHPGWVAEVNGLPQKVLEADYLFMAVPVPEGESHVVLKYKPRSFTIGLYCALVGIAIWMIAFVAYWIRRKPNVPNQRGQM